MRKSLSGIVAVVVLLGCWSQSEAGDGTTAKLMADRMVAPEGADEGKPLTGPLARFAIGTNALPRNCATEADAVFEISSN